MVVGSHSIHRIRAEAASSCDGSCGRAACTSPQQSSQLRAGLLAGADLLRMDMAQEPEELRGLLAVLPRRTASAGLVTAEGRV